MSVKARITAGLLLLLAMGLPMLLKGPDGRPVMTINDWLPDLGKLTAKVDNLASLESLQSMISTPQETEMGPLAANELVSSVPTAAKTQPVAVNASAGSGKMYKWQDAKGRWHFSSEKPAASQSVSVESLPDIENVMEAPVSKGAKDSIISFPGGLSFGGD